MALLPEASSLQIGGVNGETAGQSLTFTPFKEKVILNEVAQSPPLPLAPH